MRWCSLDLEREFQPLRRGVDAAAMEVATRPVLGGRAAARDARPPALIASPCALLSGYGRPRLTDLHIRLCATRARHRTGGLVHTQPVGSLFNGGSTLDVVCCANSHCCAPHAAKAATARRPVPLRASACVGRTMSYALTCCARAACVAPAFARHHQDHRAQRVRRERRARATQALLRLRAGQPS